MSRPSSRLTQGSAAVALQKLTPVSAQAALRLDVAIQPRIIRGIVQGDVVRAAGQVHWIVVAGPLDVVHSVCVRVAIDDLRQRIAGVAAFKE
jgi:hypothetical protein